MRLLMTTDAIGGVWTLTCELTQQLLQRGHAVALITFGREPNGEQQQWCSRILERYRDRFRFDTGEAPLEWMQENASAYAGGVGLLLRVAEEFRAELIHSHQYCWGASPCAIPRVLTAHSDVMSWGAHCQPGGLEGSEWLTRYCSLVQRGLSGASAVIAPTAWMQAALRSFFDVPSDFVVIPNGRTVALAEDEVMRELRAISVGRLWDKGKGTETLLGVESPLPILVAGENSFEGQSAAVGSLRALGVLDEAALLDLFCRSSVYIVTSYYEPFGLAPLEAALCGCAVVSRDLSSLREVWADAALFYNTSDELTRVLRGLADDPEKLQEARGKALRRARQFSASRMADEHIVLYESLLLRNGDTELSHTREFATYVS